MCNWHIAMPLKTTPNRGPGQDKQERHFLYPPNKKNFKLGEEKHSRVLGRIFVMVLLCHSRGFGCS
jgi:hypothetical protein